MPFKKVESFSDKEMLPRTKRIYYLENGEGDMKTLQQKFVDNPHPNIILMEVNGQKFGGYAGSPWNKQRTTSFGTMECFLFNINKDSRITPVIRPEHNGKAQWQW